MTRRAVTRRAVTRLDDDRLPALAIRMMYEIRLEHTLAHLGYHERRIRLEGQHFG